MKSMGLDGTHYVKQNKPDRDTHTTFYSIHLWDMTEVDFIDAEGRKQGAEREAGQWVVCPVTYVRSAE